MISQKATILCIYEILKKYSDQNHIISTETIRDKLKLIYDVDMERRAVYRNIDALRSVGVDIEGYIDNREGYYLIDRSFEPSEVRLLCDAVATSETIRTDQSKELIKKLIDTQSIFEARMLQKTVYVKSERKSVNRQIFYNIDTLNVAINQGGMVAAKKLRMNYDMELIEGDDSLTIFTPYATLWAEGHYYVLVKKEHEEELSHYRIDYLKDIVVLERDAELFWEGGNPNQYAEKYILQDGENPRVYEVECDAENWEDLVDVFEKDINVLYESNGKIRVRLKTTSGKIRSWVLSHVDCCEVLAPKGFREEIQETVMAAYRKYW